MNLKKLPIGIHNISSYEGYYSSVIYAYLQSLGLQIIGEEEKNISNLQWDKIIV